MIAAEGGAVGGAHWDEAPHGAFVASTSGVTAEERAMRLGQSPVTVLFTGLSKSGKTAVARALERRLFDLGRLATVLDGQNFRLGMSRDLGFSADDRSENLRRAAETARLMNDAGLICLTAFVAPHENVRERMRGSVGADRFLEVFLTASLDVLRNRDDEGLYAAAERGELPSFPGVTATFEEPGSPDLVMDTGELDVGVCAERVLALLRDRGFMH